MTNSFRFFILLAFTLSSVMAAESSYAIAWLTPASTTIKASTNCKRLLDTQEKINYFIPEATKIKSAETLYHVNIKADTRFIGDSVTKEDLVELFQMLGHTQFFNTSEKVTLEKGSLFLARKIDHFLTAQAEYIYDKPNQSLHLSRVSVVNSLNGQEQVISKEPLDYTGTQLLKNNVTLIFEKGASLGKVLSPDEIKVENSSTAAVQAGQVPPSGQVVQAGQKLISLDSANVFTAEVLFPTLISGTSFLKINKWSKIIPFLQHAEISVVDSVSKQNWAIRKGQFRNFLEFAKDRILKQTFGLLVIYCIADGANHFAKDVAKFMVKIQKSQEAELSVEVTEEKKDGSRRQIEHRFNLKSENNRGQK